MINVVYLVLVMFTMDESCGIHCASRSLTTVQVPQANMAQCQENQKAYSKDKLIIRNYCIVGVK